MKIPKSLSFLLLGLFLMGCAYRAGIGIDPGGGGRPPGLKPNPEFGAFLLARERINRLQPGMSRNKLIQTMQLRPLPSEEWYTAFSGGDGWLQDLSRINRVGEGELIEEYSFGYHEGSRVEEQALVVLKNGKIEVVLEFQRAEIPREGALPPPSLPSALFSDDISRGDENHLIRGYIAEVHLTPEAFERANERLKNVRVGMTGGELRYHLGGYFHRFPHGNVYFADGFLWGTEFQSFETPTGTATLMPFGYIEDGKAMRRVMIRIVDGVIREIDRVPQQEVTPPGS